MKMLGKFFLKMLLNGIFIVPLLLYLTQATLTEALLCSYAFSILSYFAIDQLLLRLTSNGVATLVDVGLVFAFLWMMERFLFDWSLTFTNMAIISVVFGITEYFMHRYFQQDPGRIGRNSFNDN
jgi:membrane protein HdeD